MTETNPSFAESLRDTPLPTDATIALHLAEPGRTGRVAQEIQSIQRGEIEPVVFHLDQLNAFVLVCYLQHAMGQIGPQAESSRIVERLALDLERMIARDCPELARLIQQGRSRGRQTPATPAGAAGPKKTDATEEGR